MKQNVNKTGACLVNKRTLSDIYMQDGFVVFFVAVTCTSNSPTCNVAPIHKKSSQLQRSVGFLYKTRDINIFMYLIKHACHVGAYTPSYYNIRDVHTIIVYSSLITCNDVL